MNVMHYKKGENTFLTSFDARLLLLTTLHFIRIVDAYALRCGAALGKFSFVYHIFCFFK